MAAMPSSKVGYLLLASVGERTPFTPPTHPYPTRALDHDNANPAAEQPLHHIPIFISVHFAYHEASCHRLRLPGVRRYGSAFPRELTRWTIIIAHVARVRRSSPIRPVNHEV
jgi:hypothetical protein